MTGKKQHDRPAELKGFSKFVRSTMEAWKVPGAAIAVVRDGEIVFMRGFGLRDVENGLPVTPQTIFALASGTKAFTTMALGLLADQGKLDWDTPVRHYLPDFKLHDPFATERITPRDLVTHRSGLPRHDMAWYNSPYEREELVHRLRYLRPNKDLREVWQYQNLMYMAAGYLIEHLTGETWETFVRRHIFEPLGMQGSNFSVEVSQTLPDYALPHKDNEGRVEQIPFYNACAVGPAGAINTNVAGMARWLLLHLNRGRLGDSQFISEGQIRQMHAPQMAMQQPAKWDELPHKSYGLGWFVEPYRGHDLIHHGGNLDGFATMTTLMPRDNIGVVVLSNLNGTPLPWLVCLNAYDRLLGLPEIAWNDRYKRDEAEQKEGEERARTTSEERRVPETYPSHPIQSYAGNFEHPGYGVLRFTHEDGKLHASYNGTQLPTAHYHYDTFELTHTTWDTRYKATFATDARGDIVSVALPLEPTVGDIVFTRMPDPALTDPSVLRSFAGEYDLFGMPMTIALVKQGLLARIPGRPDWPLVPRAGTEFLLKDLSGWSIEFIRDEGGAVVEAIVTQPDVVLTAKRRDGERTE